MGGRLLKRQIAGDDVGGADRTHQSQAAQRQRDQYDQCNHQHDTALRGGLADPARGQRPGWGMET
jgi:hypothetical protein